MQFSERTNSCSNEDSAMVRTEGPKVFQDSVHGPMEFSELLVSIIDTEEFQRLRYIKQLGFTYWVFPAAGHNRFEHSLGVCYLAGQMLEAIETNKSNEEIIKQVGQEEWEKHKLCVQIAGLCHDIGHGPFSHTWEVFVGKAKRNSNWKHEDASGQILDLIWKKKELVNMFQKYKISEKEISVIKALIAGEGEELGPSLKFLYEIVANKKNDVDVDKWDYFLRDGLTTSMSITFDYRRLLKFCKVHILSGGTTTLAFRDKERISLQDMFRMRADLHVRAYQHRVSKNIEAMFIDALLKADAFYFDEVDGKRLKLSEAQENVEEYSKLTDHIHPFLMYKRGMELKECRDIMLRMARRSLYETVNTYTIKRKLKMEEICEMEELLNREQYVISQLYIDTGKHGNPLKYVSFYDKDGNILEDVPTAGPEIHWKLPYGVVFVYYKLSDGRKDHGTAEEIVDKFLDSCEAK